MPFAKEGKRGLAEVVKEGRKIGVARIDQEPDAVQLSSVEPGRDQSSFACAGWTDYPDCVPCTVSAIQQLEQSVPLDCLGQARTRQLSQLSGTSRHIVGHLDAD